MRILVADDNKDAAQTIGALLAMRGFQPMLVNDGLEAFARLSAAGRSPTGDPGLENAGDERHRDLPPTTPASDATIPLSDPRDWRRDQRRFARGRASGATTTSSSPSTRTNYARLITGKRILDLQEQLLATQLLRQQATRDSLTGL